LGYKNPENRRLVVLVILLTLNQDGMFGKYKKPKLNVVDNYIKSIGDSNYAAGLKVGTQTAIYELRDVQKYECINLTPEEKEEVMSFLIEKNLEFGYNVQSGGFYVLKKRNL
jgi:hypothetical protein